MWPRLRDWIEWGSMPNRRSSTISSSNYYQLAPDGKLTSMRRKIRWPSLSYLQGCSQWSMWRTHSTKNWLSSTSSLNQPWDPKWVLKDLKWLGTKADLDRWPPEQWAMKANIPCSIQFGRRSTSNLTYKMSMNLRWNHYKQVEYQSQIQSMSSYWTWSILSLGWRKGRHSKRGRWHQQGSQPPSKMGRVRKGRRFSPNPRRKRGLKHHGQYWKDIMIKDHQLIGLRPHQSSVNILKKRFNNNNAMSWISQFHFHKELFWKVLARSRYPTE